MQSAVSSNLLMAVGVVSVAYIGASALTFGVLMPFQNLVLPDLTHHASALFLPHGVRVLTAWLYGWRAFILLAPSALLTHAYLFGSAGFAFDYLISALFGLFCATFSFWFFAKLGMDFRLVKARLASWREILLAGSFASIINVAGASYFYGFDFRSASAYFIGDIGGLVAAMVLLMVVFRWVRKLRQ